MSEDNKQFVLAHCGLVCSSCSMFVKGRCGGCHGEKPMFAGCPVKACCLEREIATCAECVDFENLKQCRKLNNLIAKIFGLIFRSNRIGNLERIRQLGVEQFAREMGEMNVQDQER